MTPQRTAQTEATVDYEAVPETARIIADMRGAVEGGGDWFQALMAAIRLWPAPEEEVDGRPYHYLVGGEAFDWLLLAERLCEEMADILPEEEAEELLFHGRLPGEAEASDLEKLLGAKYRRHLDFVYGVLVEEALQLAVQGEVHKERLATNIWENGSAAGGDDEVFGRIYGATRQVLFAQFCASRSQPCREEISLADLREFTYWLFKHRVKTHDPARVASDTRKGLAELQRLEALRTARRPAPEA